MKRIVVTGIGAVTPIGNSATEYAESLKNGVLGLSDITRFDTSGLSKRAFQVTGFEPPPFAKIHDPFIQYVFRAVEEALRDSGLDLSQLDRDRVGIAVSSSKGGMMTFERFYGSFLKYRRYRLRNFRARRHRNHNRFFDTTFSRRETQRNSR